MLRIKLDNKVNKTSSMRELIEMSNGSMTIVEVADKIKLVSEMLKRNSIYKLSDFVNKQATDLRTSEEFSIYKATNAIIAITNKEADDVSYRYIINMITDIKRDYSYDEYRPERNGTSTTVENDEIVNDADIDTVITMVVEAVGFKSAMLLINVLLDYDYDTNLTPVIERAKKYDPVVTVSESSEY